LRVQSDELHESEAKLKETLDNLEEKVEERTAELEEAYDSLLEKDIRLNDAQRIAHIGSWDRNLATGELYWSDEMYRIFRIDPLRFGATFDAFLSCVHPNDRDDVVNSVKDALHGKTIDIEYRIISGDGEERIVYVQGEAIFDERCTPVRTRGTIQDITERKKAEEAQTKMEIARKQEIHHRIKNNLQVISSLLGLQAEKFKGIECIKDSEVLEAFRESQDKVISMALIHEELYKGAEIDTLDFSSYIQELVENLFMTYRLGNIDISLGLNLDKNIFFDTDTAVPLGMIISELISNSLKHAFVGKDKGEIQIELCREKTEECTDNIEDCNSTNFVLTISDNGVGIPENFSIEDLDTLGIPLVTTLVDQLDGELELKRDNGTEFILRFKVKAK
jgi:two-component sensor histidine kinase